MSPTNSSDDFTAIPSANCTKCGGEWLMIPTHFDLKTYEIDAYGLEGAYCWSCEALVTPPTPIDTRLDYE
jgi:hypothetical protein